jgi:hypothetical protein
MVDPVPPDASLRRLPAGDPQDLMTNHLWIPLPDTAWGTGCGHAPRPFSPKLRLYFAYLSLFSMPPRSRAGTSACLPAPARPLLALTSAPQCVTLGKAVLQ